VTAFRDLINERSRQVLAKQLADLAEELAAQPPEVPEAK
jgi:hypothetical protein